MSRKTYIIITIILLSAFGISAGWYLFLQKSTTPEQPVETRPSQPSVNDSIIETFDWETYRSEQFGYEMKYPDVILRKYADNKNGEGISFDLEKYFNVPIELAKQRDKDDAAVGSFYLGVSISVEPAANPLHLSLRDWVWENVHEQKQAPYPKLEKDIVFVGEPAYYAEYSRETFELNGLYSHIKYSIFILHNNNIYRINAAKLPPVPSEEWKNHPYYSYLEQSVPISEAILNSFRFTDSN